MIREDVGVDLLQHRGDRVGMALAAHLEIDELRFNHNGWPTCVCAPALSD